MALLTLDGRDTVGGGVGKTGSRGAGGLGATWWSKEEITLVRRERAGWIVGPSGDRERTEEVALR